MQFYYVKKPDGEILAYTRESKAQRVAGLYNTKIMENPTEEEKDAARHMYL